MLNLVKITVFSLVVSVGAFANSTEMNQAADSQEITLQEANSDHFLGFIGDAIKGVFNFGKKLLGLNGPDICKSAKDQGLNKDAVNAVDCDSYKDAGFASKDECKDTVKKLKECKL